MKNAKTVDLAKKPLTVKQTKFIQEYVKNDGNATKAAQAVYDTKLYNTAHVIGSDNLQKPNIQFALRQAFDKAGLTVDRVSERLKHWAESDLHDASLRAINTWGNFVGANQFKISHEHEHHLNSNILQRYDIQRDTIDVTDDAS